MHVSDIDRRYIDTKNIFRYLPRLLAYPFDLHCFFTLTILSLLVWLANSAGPFGMPLLLFACAAFGQYLLAVLHRSLLGFGAAPQLTADDLRFRTVLFKFLLLMSGAGLGMYFAVQSGTLLALAIGIASWFLLPATLLLLSLEESLSVALHPARLLEVIRGSGFSYFVYCIGMFAGWLGLLMLLRELVISFESEWLLPIVLFVIFYMSVANMHLLGFIVYHRRRQIGIAALITEDIIQRQDRKDPDSIRRKMIDELDELLRRQQADKARSFLDSATQSMDGDEQITWLDATIERNLYPLDVYQAHRTINTLLNEKRGKDAIYHTLRMLNRYEQFRLPEAGNWLALCVACLDHRQFAYFEKLSVLAEKFYPDSAERLDIAMLRARYFIDIANNAEQAMAELAYYQSWQDHPQYSRMMALYRALSA